MNGPVSNSDASIDNAAQPEEQNAHQESSSRAAPETSSVSSSMEAERQAKSNQDGVDAGVKGAKNTTSSNMPAVIVFSVLAALAVLVVFQKGWLSFPLMGKEDNHVPIIVILDSVRIVEGAVQQIAEKPGVTSEQVKAEGERVSLALEKILTTYASSGITVLSKNSVIAFPPNLDVTEIVAREIGIDISSIPSR